MAREEPFEERAARRIMSRALGVDVERHDDGSSPGMFDFAFTLDGRPAAAEMTLLADERTMALHALTHAKQPIPGLRATWLAMLRPEHSARAFRRRAAAALPVLEAAAVEALRAATFRSRHNLPFPYGHPDVRWLIEQEIDVVRVGDNGDDGEPGVWIIADGEVAVVHDDVDPLIGHIEGVYRSGRFESELGKLAESGRPHRHLFVALIEGHQVPWAMLYPLSRTNSVPTRDAFADDRMTGLWLISGFGGGGLLWTRADGWRRVSTASDPEPDRPNRSNQA